MYYAMVLNDRETFTGLVGCKLVEVAEESERYDEELHVRGPSVQGSIDCRRESCGANAVFLQRGPHGSALIIAVVSGDAEIQTFERLYAERGWEHAVVVPGPITGD